MANFLSKQEREKLRESIAENNTCWQTNYVHPTVVTALLDHIDALEEQVEAAYKEGFIRALSSDDWGNSTDADTAWANSHAKAAIASAPEVKA